MAKALTAGVLATCWALGAAQLPLRRYTIADGLPNNSVHTIASDARGFLWFGTGEGLSRFDGLGFTNPAAAQGLSNMVIRKMIIGRRGNYWLATSDGLIRFRPDLPFSNPGRITVIRPPGTPATPDISVLLEDHAGKLWCGTEAGLYVLDAPDALLPQLAAVDFGNRGTAWGESAVTGLAEDAAQNIWVGTGSGDLRRRHPNGQIDGVKRPGGLTYVGITSLLIDRKGRLWVGRTASLERSLPAAQTGANGFETLSGREVPAARRVFDIFESRDGDVWVGMYRCLGQFPASGEKARVWTKDNGLPSRGVGALREDGDGNLWMGTGDTGAFKLAAGGMLTYSSGDGIGVDEVISIAETRRGELYLAGRQEAEGFRIAIRAGDGFRNFAPLVPKRVTYFGWRPARVILQDGSGEWWLASSQGLCRYRALESPLELTQHEPMAVYAARDGLPADLVTRLFEDHAGNIWVGSETKKLTYWSREAQKFVGVAAEGSPGYVEAFGEDGAGDVWMGDGEGRLWRVRSGRAQQMPGPSSQAGVHDILRDHRGRLWIATLGQGLLRFDHPEEESPQFRQYGREDGLSSLNVRSLAEDLQGSLYIGTGGGVDRLNPDLEQVRHYTLADGIAEGEVNSVYRDRSGVMWIGTNHGLTRMAAPEVEANPPPVWITGLSIGGKSAAIAEAGERNVREIAVHPGQEDIQFDFVALSYAPGNVLRYQYRLGTGNWSPPIESRSVHYGRLAPGAYLFAVRAVNSEGEVSPEPATVEFRVEPPLWRRTWFLGILLSLAVAGAVAVHRARAARLLEIERVRSNIALDLHDDIASNLSQITIFSEIALRHAGAGSAAGEPLARIAETARDTVESISDIVWSVRPQKEGDLSQRIRRFGSDALTSRQIDVAFHISDAIHRLLLEPNVRRQVYLIYKEAVHNTVKHAQATAVQISMDVAGGRLLLKIRDNGRGMQSPEEGNGLPGMRTRAMSLGGKLEIRSGTGAGTEVRLDVPLKQRRGAAPYVDK